MYEKVSRLNSKVFFILIQYVIFYNRFSLPGAKAITGVNVIEVRDNEFLPLVTILQYHGPNPRIENDIVCTGTLISLDHVLTAEHCVLPLNYQRILLLIGSYDVREARRFSPMWWLSYNHWYARLEAPNPYRFNDIAVIKLLTRALAHIIPAPLSQTPIHQLYGLEGTILGWGIGNNGRYSRFLNKATVDIISTTECLEIASFIAGSQINIPEQYFCSRKFPRIHLDKGDSGGPLLNINRTIIGINIGKCPRLNDLQHPEKSNLHIAVANSLDFFQFVLNQ